MSRTFFETERLEHVYRPVAERIGDYREVEVQLEAGVAGKLASRCQNCGLPFCHAMGCPLQNAIPDINRAVMQGNWQEAWLRLAETSPFPEFTSRVCPALCEAACCLEGEAFGATNVRQIEKKIVETYAARNENGEPIILEGGRIQLKDLDAKIAFEKEINELRNTEVEDIEKVSLSEGDFADKERIPTPNELLALEPIIEFVEAEV